MNKALRAYAQLREDLLRRREDIELLLNKLDAQYHANAEAGGYLQNQFHDLGQQIVAKIQQIEMPKRNIQDIGQNKRYKILKAIKDYPLSTAVEICEMTGLTRDNVSWHLSYAHKNYEYIKMYRNGGIKPQYEITEKGLAAIHEYEQIIEDKQKSKDEETKLKKAKSCNDIASTLKAIPPDSSYSLNYLHNELSKTSNPTKDAVRAMTYRMMHKGLVERRSTGVYRLTKKGKEQRNHAFNQHTASSAV